MFTVKEIKTGDIIVVEPNWIWGGTNGNEVVVFGYHNPEEGQPGAEFAKKKLKAILENRQVELKNPNFYPNEFGYDKLVCSVYLDGVDISSYFPEFKTRNPGFIK